MRVLVHAVDPRTLGDGGLADVPQRELMYVREVPPAPEAIEVSGAGIRLTGFASAGLASDRPLLLLLHGGGVDAHYFDPVVELATANGFPAIALNRPGYTDSGSASFARQAEAIDAAMGELWRTWGDGRPGAVVLGHSIGGAVAVHLAARKLSWRLLGISITGISAAVPPFLVQVWESLTPGDRIAFTPEASGTIKLAGAAAHEPATPTDDLLEVAKAWPDDLPRLAAEVTIPLQYAVGERDKLWVVGEATPREFAALFANAPYVDAQLLPDVGHAVEHAGVLGRSHQLRQLSFALRCTGPPGPSRR
jgi:pimeloyl-ACP methyl ester carboxylesterase